MARVSEKRSTQSLACRLIELDAGESATVILKAPNHRAPAAKVNWGDGGASWSLKPKNDGDAIEVAVDYSLFQAGQGDEDWIPHVESPFEEAKQENEYGRCDRIRFSNAAGSSTIYVTIASNARLVVEKN